jgi:hypothetical protein
MTNMQQHLIDAIDSSGFESCEYFNPCRTEKEKAAFSYNRFMSEMGWLVKQAGIKRVVNDWLSGLALNIAYNNHDILELGEKWGEINENASEARQDFYIEHWFNNLSASLIYLWKKHSLT